MRTNFRKIGKSVLIASAFAVATPALAGGMVIGTATATRAVGKAVETSVYGESPSDETIQDRVITVPERVAAVATHDPVPLSPLVRTVEKPKPTQTAEQSER